MWRRKTAEVLKRAGKVHRGHITYLATEDFHFKVLHVFAGVGSVVVYDAAAFGLRACEVFDFDAEGKVRKATAHYGRG